MGGAWGFGMGAGGSLTWETFSVEDFGVQGLGKGGGFWRVGLAFCRRGGFGVWEGGGGGAEVGAMGFQMEVGFEGFRGVRG